MERCAIQHKFLLQLIGAVHLVIVVGVKPFPVLIGKAYRIQGGLRRGARTLVAAHQRKLWVIDGDQELDILAAGVADIDQCAVIADGRDGEGQHRVARHISAFLGRGDLQIVGIAGLQLGTAFAGGQHQLQVILIGRVRRRRQDVILPHLRIGDQRVFPVDDIPFACIDIVGQPDLEHTVDGKFHRQRFFKIAVVVVFPLPHIDDGVIAGRHLVNGLLRRFGGQQQHRFPGCVLVMERHIVFRVGGQRRQLEVTVCVRSSVRTDCNRYLCLLVLQLFGVLVAGIGRRIYRAAALAEAGNGKVGAAPAAGLLIFDRDLIGGRPEDRLGDGGGHLVQRTGIRTARKGQCVFPYLLGYHVSAA